MTKRKVNSSSSKDLLTSFGIDKYKSKKGEKYMSKKQLNHFELILLTWKTQLEQEADKTVNHMQRESINYADPNDRASQESDFGLELRTRDRERKLLKKIQQFLLQFLHNIQNSHFLSL